MSEYTEDSDDYAEKYLDSSLASEQSGKLFLWKKIGNHIFFIICIRGDCWQSGQQYDGQ